jgi:hypothetical protein
MIVKTRYPWTHGRKLVDTADNILERPLEGYDFSVERQRQFLIDLTQTVISNSGLGLLY